MIALKRPLNRAFAAWARLRTGCGFERFPADGGGINRGHLAAPTARRAGLDFATVLPAATSACHAHVRVVTPIVSMSPSAKFFSRGTTPQATDSCAVSFEVLDLDACFVKRLLHRLPVCLVTVESKKAADRIGYVLGTSDADPFEPPQQIGQVRVIETDRNDAKSPFAQLAVEGGMEFRLDPARRCGVLRPENDDGRRRPALRPPCREWSRPAESSSRPARRRCRPGGAERPWASPLCRPGSGGD